MQATKGSMHRNPSSWRGTVLPSEGWGDARHDRCNSLEPEHSAHDLLLDMHCKALYIA